VDWTQAVRDLGLPVVELIAIAFGIWKVGTWIGGRVGFFSDWFAREIVIPVRDRFLGRLDRFFDRTEATMDALTANVQTVSTHMELQTGILRRIEQQGCGQRQTT